MTTDNSTAKSTKEDKARVFTFLLYPDSAPKDFAERLAEKQGLPIAISPLHDKDKVEDPKKVDEAYLEQYGGFKKPHYHCIIYTNNPLTPSAIRKRLQRALSDEDGVSKAVSHVQICDYIKGAYEYLTHESVDAVRKKKHKYSKDDIVHIHDFDIARYVTVSADERKQNMHILIGLIRNHGLCNVIDLLDYVEANPDCGIDLDATIDATENRSNMLRLYFDGQYQRFQREERIDRERRMDAVRDEASELYGQVQDMWAKILDHEEKMRRQQS